MLYRVNFVPPVGEVLHEEEKQRNYSIAVLRVEEIREE